MSASCPHCGAIEMGRECRSCGWSAEQAHWLNHYTADERRAHGKKLARARANVAEALRVAELLAQSAAAEGVPETQIAAELGVDRMTVRKWKGKR